MRVAVALHGVGQKGIGFPKQPGQHAIQPGKELLGQHAAHGVLPPFNLVGQGSRCTAFPWTDPTSGRTAALFRSSCARPLPESPLRIGSSIGGCTAQAEPEPIHPPGSDAASP